VTLSMLHIKQMSSYNKTTLTRTFQSREFEAEYQTAEANRQGCQQSYQGMLRQ